MRRDDNERARGRDGERGAALITALLVSLLLLAAGGALIYTTGMSATNAVDATAEAQAYYAAEAGLHSALSVLRGNVAKQAGLKQNVKIKNNLRVANQLSTSNVESDKATDARLSGWLPYESTDKNSRVLLGDNGGLAFSIKLEDPDDNGDPAAGIPPRDKLTKDASYLPKSLLITSTGYGPRGSVKQMQLLYTRSAFDFDPPSTMLMAGNVTHFAVGSSNAKGYSGKDESKPGAATLPMFGFTAGGSETYAGNTAFNCGSQNCNKAKAGTTDPETDTISQAKLPSWLRNSQDAAALLNSLEEQAVDNDRYYATKDGKSVPGIGTPADSKNGKPADPKFTFIDGNYSASGGGAGLLVVTGNLEFKGNFNFDGIILVLGSYKDSGNNLVGGHLDRNGGGNGEIAGALVVAKFDRAKPDKFLDTWFDTDGGGNSDIVFNSVNVSNALGTLGGRVLGVVEN